MSEYFYDYGYESYIASPSGKKRMEERMADLGDQGYRVHTFTPVLTEGMLTRYEVLYERARIRNKVS